MTLLPRVTCLTIVKKPGMSLDGLPRRPRDGRNPHKRKSPYDWALPPAYFRAAFSFNGRHQASLSRYHRTVDSSPSSNDVRGA